MKKLIAIACTLLVISSNQSFSASIDERQQNQRERISNGIKSGEMTRREANKTIKQQRRIAAKEARFKSDGKFTRKERANIQHSLNKSSSTIYRKKHNRANRK